MVAMAAVSRKRAREVEGASWGDLSKGPMELICAFAGEMPKGVSWKTTQLVNSLNCERRDILMGLGKYHLKLLLNVDSADLKDRKTYVLAMHYLNTKLGFGSLTRMEVADRALEMIEPMIHTYFSLFEGLTNESGVKALRALELKEGMSEAETAWRIRDAWGAWYPDEDAICDLSDKGFGQVPHELGVVRGLRRLVLSRNPLISVEGLPKVLPKLRSLDLEGLNLFTLKGMPIMPKLTHLTPFRLRGRLISTVETLRWAMAKEALARYRAEGGGGDVLDWIGGCVGVDLSPEEGDISWLWLKATLDLL